MTPMRFIIMHKTNAHWESGAVPSAALIARVGEMLVGLANAGVLLGAEGLRASAEGVRLRFAAGQRTVINGPFDGAHALPAGFSIVRAASLEDAIEWASRRAQTLGDAEQIEFDIRPVSEPWDIGMAPAPAGVTARRYMVLQNATPATESGETPSAPQRAALRRVTEEGTGRVEHILSETMRPSRKGRRYKNSQGGMSVLDGPFTETKELIAGYIIVSSESLDNAGRWAEQYLRVVEAEEVEVRELEA
jgi:hypothetical protein